MSNVRRFKFGGLTALLALGTCNLAWAQAVERADEQAPPPVEQIAVEAAPAQVIRGGMPLGRGNVDPEAAKRIEQHLHQLLSVEVGLAKRVCNLDETQIAEVFRQVGSIAEIGDVVISRGGNAFRLNVGFANPSAVVAQLPGGQALRRNPIDLISKHVHVALIKVVGEELASLYADEAKARDAFRRDANIEAVLVILEPKLALTPSQVDELKQKLSSQWQGASLFNSRMYRDNADFVPTLPIQALQETLTPQQLGVWSDLRRANFAYQFAQPTNEVRWDE